MKNYQPIIGLEIHIELNTQSKMFCACSADHFQKKPNTQICPTCLGLPGALPSANQQAIERVILAGMALGCQIPLESKFDRKNYFYPDLAKGYQISQYDQPLAVNGKLNGVRIRRVHLEEDTAKLVHQGQKTLIDFNRSGVPLMEIVTEPDIHSSQQAKDFLKQLQQIIRRLGISGCDMEKGSMRIEPNISVSQEIDKLPNYKVEIKNINSFRFSQQAIEYEIKRQKNLLKKGQKLVQETRGWNPKKNATYSQRSKEEAHDYRYFPEPDLPPMNWTKKQIDHLRDQLPELPDQQKKRLQKDFGLSDYQVNVLTSNPQKIVYFEKSAPLAAEKSIPVQVIINFILNDRVDLNKVKPAQLIKQILAQKTQTPLNSQTLTKIIKEVLAKNQKAVGEYRTGKIAAIEFLLGQVMGKTHGQANPNLTRQKIKSLLTKL